MLRGSQTLRTLAVLWMAAAYSASAAQEGSFPDTRLTDAPFVLKADEVSYEPERDTYEAVGNVRIDQEGGGTLTADWLAFNATTRVGVASGNVRIRDGEDTITAEFAAVDLDTLVALATDAILDAGSPGFVVAGDPIHKTGTNTYHIEDGTFTTCRCPPDTKCLPWQIESAEADIRVGGYAVSKQTTFKVRDIPIFYTPWFVVPVKTKRQTGFMVPHFSSDSRSGYSFEIPFFWAARDNLNVLLTPSYLTKRGMKYKGEFEYLFGEEGLAEGGASILPSDNEVDRDDPETAFSDNRWSYWLWYDQPLGEGLRLAADVERVSDNDYVLDFEDLPSETRNQRFLWTTAWSSFARGPYYADAAVSLADDLQSPDQLDRDDFLLQRLPDVELASLQQRLGRLPFWANLATNYIYFYQNDDESVVAGNPPVSEQFFDTGEDGLYNSQELNSAGIADGADNSMDDFDPNMPGGTQFDKLFQEGELLADHGHRLDFNPRASLPLQLGMLETLSEVSFRETLYWPSEASSERREIWTGRFDARTRFERFYSFHSQRLRHIVEPKLAFVLVSTPTQSRNPLFIPPSSVRPARLIDFDGRVLTRNPADRIADERLLQFSLGSRLFAAPEGPGRAPRLVGEFRIGSGYDFERGRMAQIFLTAGLSIWEHLRLYAELGYDSKETRVEEAGAGLSWMAERGHELALSYRYVRDIPLTFEAFEFDSDVFDNGDDEVDRINQLSARARWILSQRWELFGDGYYSLDESSTNEGSLGILYRSLCNCWELTAELEQRVRPNTTRFEVRLHLAGLGQTF